jgi:3-phytase
VDKKQMKTILAIFTAVAVLGLIWMIIFSPFSAEPQDGVPAGIVTEATRWDSDDPAIWIHPQDPGQSLIIGTDKHREGGLYAFDLQGKIVRTVTGLQGPNNVDVAYGFPLQDHGVDIAVVTERLQQRLRIFQLPDLAALDDGGLIVFDGDRTRAPMGVALYKRPKDQAMFVFVGGKSGPRQGYIAQYRLQATSENKITMQLVRQFGAYSGKKEIEAIAVDAELGYVYYSDETVGVRKYHADPDAANANTELALFATDGFTGDHEGIAIFKKADGTGYILVSDQQANSIRLYSREGTAASPHEHRFAKSVRIAARETDGIEVTSQSLSAAFPNGMLVAMSNGKVFHYYALPAIAGKIPL